MSVRKIGLVPGRESKIGKITEGTAKLYWLAVTTDNADDESIIANYGYGNQILPIPYVSFHPVYTVMLCREINFKQDSKAPRKWNIDATYSSEPLSQSERESEVENPLERPAKVTWKTNQYRKPFIKDRDGKACMNSAGDFFDPPPEKDASHWTVAVTKNVPAVPQFILDYEDAINSNSFSIQGVPVGPGKAKLMDLSIGEIQAEGGFTFLPFAYTMELRREGWTQSELDQGMRYKDGSDRKAIMDDHKPSRPITSPKLLDGSGGVLANPTPDNAKFIDLEPYVEKNFAVLPGITEIANPPTSGPGTPSPDDEE